MSMSDAYMNTQSFNDGSILCQDPSTKGFDLQAGQSWIYPTNYPIREYQYNITKASLYKNTLVSLPTGLGKTFIAAVVMYNFYRWYPHDKIIFMAPTRPLVKQQMDACYNIMAIPPETTAELTGSKAQQSRSEIWHSKRVFFITPQVLQNDLEIILELGSKIKCLVFDEAHRAKGNHAYCEVIRRLLSKNRLFRVLALSATPGNSTRDVLDVMKNLLIAHLEFRSEESPDVKPYVFDRALETVVVPLGDKLQEIKDHYMQILEKYTRTLVECKVIYGNCCNLTKGKIFMVMKEFQAKNSGARYPRYGEIMKTLNICVTLYHAYETLVRCGLRAFLNFYEEHINNPLLRGNVALIQILGDLRGYLGPAPEVEPLPDGTYAPIPSSTKFGHPKFYQLKEILMAHFTDSSESSRVMVFFEYRETTVEAYAILTQSYPLIRPRVFVGQGSGVTQKQQINTVKAFRDGTCNTLLSTCIGEEGLDVGEVDLIVCFDIANKSPIRMIQRMGRTGRKKEGKIIVLVTEGKEQQTLKDCLVYKSNLGDFAMNPKNLEQGIYTDNPKMVPSYVESKCEKIFITVKKQPVLPRSNSLKDMFRNMLHGPKFPPDLEILEVKERILNTVVHLWNKTDPLSFHSRQTKLNYSKHLEKQRSFQACDRIRHSKSTEVLVSLLQYADSKRYNIPVTQNLTSGPFLKQRDIRSMFNKKSSQSQVPTQFIDKEKDVPLPYPAELFQEMSTYLSLRMASLNDCLVCNELFQCSRLLRQKSEVINFSLWTQPDVAILDTITAQDLNAFCYTLNVNSVDLADESDIFRNIPLTQLENKTPKQTGKPSAQETLRNVEVVCLDDSQNYVERSESSFAYETPKSFAEVLKRLEPDIGEMQLITPNSTTTNLVNSKNKPELNLLQMLPVEVEVYVRQAKAQNTTIDDLKEDESINRLKAVLIFFNCTLDEFLANVARENGVDLDETTIFTPNRSPRGTNKKSPVVSEESPDLFAWSEEKVNNVDAEAPGSPILNSYVKSQELKVKKKLFDSSRNEFDLSINKPNLNRLNQSPKSFFKSTNITRDTKNTLNIKAKPSSILEINDISDLSNFGITSDMINNTRKYEVASQKKINVSFLDIDTSFLGLRKEKPEDEVASQKKINVAFLDICDTSSLRLLTGKKKSTKSRGTVCNMPSNKDEEKKSYTLFDTRRPNVCSNKKSFVQTKTLENSHKVEDLNATHTDSTSYFLRQDSRPKNGTPVNEKKSVLELKDVCDISSFLSECKRSEESLSDLDQNTAFELSNVSDLSSFLSECQKSEQSISEVVQNPASNKTFMEVTKVSPPLSLIHINENLGKQSSAQASHDYSFFLREPDNEANKNIIDLTASDGEPSPVKTRVKITSQLTLSQTFSMTKISETERKDRGQEENAFITTQRSQTIRSKSVLSLRKHNKNVLQLEQTPHSNKSNETQAKEGKVCDTPNMKKLLFNTSTEANSDDEFEASPIFSKPTFTPKSVKRTKEVAKELTMRRKRLASEFLDPEAEVDGTASEDENSGEDCFEASFVTDDTQDLLNTTNMHAKYLQSIKSPGGRGKFKIPLKPRHNITNVYSQDVCDEGNSYVNDSFCVNSQDNATERFELSTLEILEMKLRERKKDKKRKKSQETSEPKRRRIVIMSDDSD